MVLLWTSGYISIIFKVLANTTSHNAILKFVHNLPKDCHLDIVVILHTGVSQSMPMSNTNM